MLQKNLYLPNGKSYQPLFHTCGKNFVEYVRMPEKSYKFSNERKKNFEDKSNHKHLYKKVKYHPFSSFPFESLRQVS